MKFLSILLVLIFTLRASELGLLLEVKNNSLFHFSVKNIDNICVVYGVVTFDMLKYKSKSSKLCQKSLNDYYENNPKDRYFALTLLYINQLYPFDKKKDSCIIYAKGKRSYAELLLEKGLAVVPRDFDDKVLSFKYRRIENWAKINKKGLWSSPILRNCISHIGTFQ